MPTIGDTIRLTGEFRGWDGNLADPDEAKVIIYDSQYNEIAEYTPNKLETGKYYLDYIVPFGKTNVMYFEYKGISGDMPQARRRKFERIWAK